MSDFGVCEGSDVGTGSVLLLEGGDVSVAELVQERSEEERCEKKWRVCPEVEKV